ncbi:MAG: type II toxin-antitoxin system PemK/MazF family toxin [Bdellovibrionota bacterium]
MRRGEIYQVTLDPVQGSEQRGFRYAAIVSLDSMNQALNTVIIVPLTTKKKTWPTRVDTLLNGIDGQAQCEQIRVVAKTRLKNKAGELTKAELAKIRVVFRQMLVE